MVSRARRATRRPRILVVGSTWPPQTFLRRLFAGLAEDFELRLVTRRPVRATADVGSLAVPSDAWPWPLRAAGRVAAGTAALARSSRARRLWRAERALPAADRLQQLSHLRRAVDALYFPWNFSAAEHLPLLRLGLPSVISCRGTQVMVAPERGDRDDLVARLPETFELATRVHCVSRASLDAAVLQGLESHKADIIRPAVDPAFFSPGRKPPATDARCRLLAIGGLSWRKGFQDLIVVAQRLRADGHQVTLNIVGSGADRQRLVYLIHDLGLTRKVNLLGGLDEAGVRRQLRSSDIFVLSSFSEGISNAALEAMACGVAVVSTRCGGMEEAIRDGVDGLLVPLHEPNAMAGAIARLIDDAELRSSLAASARQRVLDDFSLAEHIRAWTTLWREVLGQEILLD